MLTSCPALNHTRAQLISFLMDKSRPCPPLLQIVTDIFHSSPLTQVQFLLDPCHIPAISDLCVTMGADMLSHIFYLTRTFAYYMHRSKMLSLGRWPGDPGRRLKSMITKPIGLASKKPINNPNILLTTSTNFSFVGPTDVPSQGHVVNAVSPQYQHIDKNDIDLCVTFPPCTNSSKHAAINLLPSNAGPVHCCGAVSNVICLPSAQPDLQNSVGDDRPVTGSGYC